jgi:hypothetical protein
VAHHDLAGWSLLRPSTVGTMNTRRSGFSACVMDEHKADQSTRSSDLSLSIATLTLQTWPQHAKILYLYTAIAHIPSFQKARSD